MINQLPHHLHFGGLAPGEKVRLFLRRHPIVFIRRAIVYIFFAIIPPVAWIFLYTQTDWLDDSSGFTRVLFVLLVSLFYLFWMRQLFTDWIDYYLDVWVVTTRRIIKVEQVAMFHRTFAEQQLSRIQDMSTNVHGFWRTILKFGDIRVQTAAEIEDFTFKDIPNPELVTKEISNLLDEMGEREKAAHIAQTQGLGSPEAGEGTSKAEESPVATGPITFERK